MIDVQLGTQSVPVQIFNTTLGGVRALSDAAQAVDIDSRARKSANLSDLASASTALANLGGAAKSANLSDLANAATARANIGADLAANVNFTPTGTGGVARPVQTSLRERPVSVLDYYDPADGSDYGPAFSRALSAATNVFWPNDGVTRTISTAVTVTVSSPRTVDFNNARVVCAAPVNILSPIVADVGLDITANVARFASSATINTPTGIQSGDLFHIQSSATPFTGYPDTKADVLAIRSISGSVLTFSEAFNYAWTTAETVIVTIWRPQSVTILNPNLVSTQVDGETTGTYCLRVTGGRATVRGGSLSGSTTFTPFSNFYRTGIQFYHCFGVVVDDVASADMSYPFGAYGGTRNVQETNTRSRHCRHGILDMGQSASGYRGSGHQGSDNFITVSAHPSFDVNVSNLTAVRDQFLPALRCVGGSLVNVYVGHLDNNVDATQTQNLVPSAGFETLYERADFIVDNLTLDNPSRSALDLKIPYGRNVTVGRFSGYDVEMGSAVTNPVVIKPLALTAGKTGPASTGLKAGTQVADASLLDAYLEGGAYKINPRRSSVLQSGKTLYARGQVFRKQAPGTYTVTIHTNAFSGIVTATYLVGRLKLKGFVQHESTGFFSAITREYAFGVTDSSVNFPTTAAQTVGPTTGSGGTDIDLVVSSPAFSGGGAGGDTFIQISVALTTAIGVSNPAFGLTYELDLSETFAA